MALFKLQGFLALALALWGLWQHVLRYVPLDDESRSRFTAAYVAWALAYQPFWTIYRVGGQTTPTILLLFVAALLGYIHRRVVATTFLLTLVILIKPAFVLPIGLLGLATGVWLCVALSLAGGISVALSILLAGSQVHADFMRLMLDSTKVSASWVYNSAATVAIENLRLLTDPIRYRAMRPANLTWAVDAARLVIGGIFLYSAWKARRTDGSFCEEARRSTTYLMCLTFGLALIPTTWEHYLSVLFLPLIHLFAVRNDLPRGARLLTWIALLLAAVQNLILIEWLDAHWAVDTLVEAIAIGLVKGGPILLAVWLFARYRAEISHVLDQRVAQQPDAASQIVNAAPAH
jgi:hypothetical protein